jgi:phenylalanyl-tRNA synthetase alpha chain
MISILRGAEVRRALSIRDLTDDSDGLHAMQLLVNEAERALADSGARLVRHRAHPVVSIEDNYDRLGYPPEGPTRDARYTRYVSRTQLLRSHTSAMIPPLLRRLDGIEHALLSCPGIVYRRDVIDRIHTGEPHQLDLWRVRRGEPLSERDLEEMIGRIVAAIAPGRVHRTTLAVHPYTLAGRQIDVQADGRWMEIGECGLAHPEVLRGAGLDPRTWSGLAMGLGLDRLLMLRKGIDDIRLLRSTDPRVVEQMLDLSPYRQVSRQPAVRRDMSLAIDADLVAEELGDRVRSALGDGASAVEIVEVLSETPYEAMPPQARARIGMGPSHKNVLLRVVLRDLARSLTHEEANQLRDRIYSALHEGERSEWACAP